MLRRSESDNSAACFQPGARRVVAFALGLSAVVLLASCASSSSSSSSKPTSASASASASKVLLIGDSIMDQEGGAAAFALRQRGIDATTVAHWGSGLFTRAQYDYGKSIPAAPAHVVFPHWLSEAKALVDRERPSLVVVALNHNYFPPFPRDANGAEIASVESPAARTMIATQTEALLAILRAHGARVAFVTPPPDGTEHAPGDNPIWAATVPVLDEHHIAVIDVAPAVAGPDGARVEKKHDCRDNSVAVRKAGEVHYTRYGAALAGTRLAQGIAALVERPTDDLVAPGDRAVALVPTASGKGYWIVQCDGAIFHFGDAPAVDDVAADASNPFVSALRAPTGLWLVARDGTMLPTGGAPARAPVDPSPHDLVATSGPWRVTASGRVTATDGRVLQGPSPKLPVVAMAATPDGNGVWLVGADGSVAARGAARLAGDARPVVVPPAVAAVLPPGPPPPIAAITAAPNGGYWIMRDNGAVVGRGGATVFGETAHLALFTT